MVVLCKKETGTKLQPIHNTPHCTESEIITRDVVFESKGVNLYGRFFFPKKEKQKIPVLILICGIGGRKEWFDPVFPNAVCPMGMALFTFDLRGHHPSGGTMDGNLEHDLDAAVNQVMKIDCIDSDCIILAGQCVGALIGNSYAANRQMIKGVVNISSFLPKKIRGKFSRNVSDAVMALIKESKTHNANIDEDSFFDDWASHLQVYRNVSMISPRNILFVHYDNDPACPSKRIQFLFSEISNENKTINIINNNHKTWISEDNHAISYDDPDVATVVANWLNENYITQQDRVGIET